MTLRSSGLVCVNIPPADGTLTSVSVGVAGWKALGTLTVDLENRDGRKTGRGALCVMVPILETGFLAVVVAGAIPRPICEEIPTHTKATTVPNNKANEADLRANVDEDLLLKEGSFWRPRMLAPAVDM
mmetsp:Transcript_19088/g.26701  ORF Transcript_19088/g.26701 Transcript_19088/m.26701 type:complete len:128 (-) Transcript_19088:58-441(-)